MHLAYKIMIHMGVIDIILLLTYFLQSLQMLSNSNLGRYYAMVKTGFEGLLISQKSANFEVPTWGER